MGVLAMVPLALGKILKGCSDAGPKKNADRTAEKALGLSTNKEVRPDGLP